MYNALVRQNSELSKIVNTTDTFASIMAKVKLSTSGLTLDLGSMGSTAAEALSIVVSKQQDTLQSSSGPFKKLIDDISKTGKGSADQIVKASQVSADSINKQIDLINKQIKKIKELADAKKKALDEELSDETTLLQIKKKQMEYADALASGDISRAAQAQLDIQQLTRTQEVTLARRSIDDKANKDIKAEEAKIEALQNRLDSLQKTVNNAQESAANANKKSDNLKKLLDEVVALVVAAGDGVDKSESARRDELMSRLTKAGYKDLAQSISGAGGGKYEGSTFVPNKDNLAQLGKTSFSDAYDASKKALRVAITDPETIRILAAIASGNSAGDGKYSTRATAKQIDQSTTYDSRLIKTGDKAGYLDDRGKAWVVLNEKLKSGQFFDYAGKQYKVGKNQVATRLSLGGPVWGAGTATSDSIPAMLSNGEYVINASSVKTYGQGIFDKFNEKKFAAGGAVGPNYNIPTSSVSLGNSMGSRYNGGGQVYNYSAGGIVVNPAQGQSERQIAEYVVGIIEAKNGLRTSMSGERGRYLQS
jgi:hypothetical protein